MERYRRSKSEQVTQAFIYTFYMAKLYLNLKSPSYRNTPQLVKQVTVCQSNAPF